MHKAEQKIARYLRRIAKIYTKARFPDGVKGKHMYLTMCIIKDTDEDRIAIMFNNDYPEADMDCPIDHFERIEVKYGKNN